MPFSASGVYTPAAGALTAAPGGIIQSSVWNAIFTDMTAAFTALGGLVFFIPFVPKSVNYTTVLTDAQKCIQHSLADNNPRTFTIDSNANVAYQVGAAISFDNEINTLTIAITADTLVWAQTNGVGPRTLAAGGFATAVKTGTTKWKISGTGLS